MPTLDVGDGHTYATIAAALAAVPADLTGQGVFTIELYDKAAGYDEAVSTTSFTGKSVADHIEFVAMTPHSGVPGQGIVVNPSVDPGDGVTFRLGQYDRMFGVGISESHGASSAYGVVTSGHNWVVNCFVFNIFAGANAYGIFATNAVGDDVIYGNCVYNINGSNGLAARGISVGNASGATTYLLNNSVYRVFIVQSGRGGGIQGNTNVHAENNVAMYNTNTQGAVPQNLRNFLSFGGAVAFNNNVSMDGTALTFGGTGNIGSEHPWTTFKNPDVSFVTDLHLRKNGQSVGNGKDLTTLLASIGVSQLDEDGNDRDRSGTWDIGAFAFYSTPGAKAGATYEVGSGKPYSDIQSAIDAIPGDLNDQGVHRVLVYDGTHAQNIDAYTGFNNEDAESYITIEAAVSHGGDLSAEPRIVYPTVAAGTGVLLGHYCQMIGMIVTDSGGAVAGNNGVFCIFEGVLDKTIIYEINSTSTPSAVGAVVRCSATLRNTVFHLITGGNPGDGFGLSFNFLGYDGVLTVQNCVADSMSSSSSSGPSGFFVTDSFHTPVVGTVVMENNYGSRVTETSTPDEDVFTLVTARIANLTFNNNASDDGTAGIYGGSGNLTLVDPATVFTDTSVGVNFDAHHLPNSPLLEKGKTLSGFSEDWEGDERLTGIWDIGVDQLSSTPPVAGGVEHRKKRTALRRGGAGAGALHRLRRNRKVRQQPVYGLFRTSTINSGDNPLDTDARFPDRLRPITIFATVRRDAVTSNGIILELGGNGDAGLALWIDGEDLGFAAGANAGNGGVSLLATGWLEAVDKNYDIIAAAEPGTGKIRLWVDGVLAGTAIAVNEQFDGEWAGAEDGAVGAVETTVTDRVPVGQRVALVDATIVGNISVYDKQRPREWS